MTAFLFIPDEAAIGAGSRVDFGNIGALFRDVEDPQPAPWPSHKARFGLLALVVLGALGDILLVARPDVLARSLAAAPPAPSVRGTTV